jgi:hypothetical protein
MPSSGDSALCRLTRLVEEMERGRPPRFLDRATAISTLLDQILVAPWETAEERGQAQRLVTHLERARQPAGAT